ncbi:MAG: type II toxin-antitoxin system HicA family toxin [Syntrophorhabdales bacterium]
MPKLPRLSAAEAENMLLQAGFRLERSKGSHRIYMKEKQRIIIPFHTGKILHPKIVNQVLKVTKG